MDVAHESLTAERCPDDAEKTVANNIVASQAHGTNGLHLQLPVTPSKAISQFYASCFVDCEMAGPQAPSRLTTGTLQHLIPESPGAEDVERRDFSCALRSLQVVSSFVTRLFCLCRCTPANRACSEARLQFQDDFEARKPLSEDSLIDAANALIETASCACDCETHSRPVVCHLASMLEAMQQIPPAITRRIFETAGLDQALLMTMVPGDASDVPSCSHSQLPPADSPQEDRALHVSTIPCRLSTRR